MGVDAAMIGHSKSAMAKGRASSSYIQRKGRAARCASCTASGPLPLNDGWTWLEAGPFELPVCPVCSGLMERQRAIAAG